MNYYLSWHTYAKILVLGLAGYIHKPQLLTINQKITTVLDECQRPISLLIDAQDLVANYYTADDLRLTQTYLGHPKLRCMLAISETKLNRLVMLLAFSGLRPDFTLFDSQSNLEVYLNQLD